MEKRPGQVVSWRPSENGVANPEQQLSRVSISDMERVKKHLIDNYGYDPGSYTDFPGDESNRKLLARIDWNINNKHRFSMRYNYTKNNCLESHQWELYRCRLQKLENEPNLSVWYGIFQLTLFNG